MLDSLSVLQPFYVLHKASTCQHRVKKPVGRSSRKVKVNLSASLATSDEGEISDDQLHENLRMKIFHDSWVKIESTIKVNLFTSRL